MLALGWTLWRRRAGLALYVGTALVAIAVLSLFGTVPWIMGKSLAIASPAVLLAGMAGGAILIGSRRTSAALAGILVLGGIAGGVLWSNFLQYRHVTLAPRARLSELAHIGGLLSGHGPTFFNEYEIYGTRHFLREGAPVSPAEYRPVDLPTLGGALLTDAAWANIDSFALATLAPYKSLVIRVGPTESLPPSLYRLVWAGADYQLWQQPSHPRLRVISHTPLGDSQSDAYCGRAENVQSPNPNPLCPIAPASVASCPQVLSLARTAREDHAELRAYQRSNPIVLRATDTQWTGAGWIANIPGGQLTPTVAGGSATAHVHIPFGVKDYQLWLGGSFDRGFDVTVDGRAIGRVADDLDPIGAYERVGTPFTHILKPAGTSGYDALPVVEWLAYFFLSEKPERAQIYESFLAFVPGIAGAYGAAVGRGVVDNLFPKK